MISVVKAIEERWENGYQIREDGGWVKVRGQIDPRADVRALIARIREFEGVQTGHLRTALREGTDEDARAALELAPMHEG